MILLLLLPALAVTREAALDSAAAYAVHAWTMSAANQTASCSDDYLSDYAAGTHTGLPYDWGGYVSIAEFDEQIADGYGAGSHSWHGVLSCTTGVDCSGYLSMVWETDHYATSTFDAVSTTISLAALTRADALNDPGSHMVLYTYETDAGVPVFYEAAGGASRVRLNSSSGWSYLDGYEPIRFDGIEEGEERGTAGEPIEITAFPFTDYRWTAGAASDRIDVYACAPSTDERGPEVLYRFEAAAPGVLSAVISDDAGVDVDIHVLTGPEGEDCLERDDTQLSVTVPAGEVWISIDTYAADGEEFPGPYLLTVDFEEGAEPEPEEEPEPEPEEEPELEPEQDESPATGDGSGPPGTRSLLAPLDESPGLCASAGRGGGALGAAMALGLALLRRRRARGGIGA